MRCARLCSDCSYWCVLRRDTVAAVFKFQFLRTTDPGAKPSWAHDPSPQAAAALPSFEELAGDELAPVCRSVWEWMLGNRAPENDPAQRDADAGGRSLTVLRSDLVLKGAGAEAQRVRAAFDLVRDAWGGGSESGDGGAAAGAADARAALLEALTDESFEAGMRAAMHALGCGGDAVVPALIERGLSHPSPLVAGRAAEALGEAAHSPTRGVVAALCQLAERMQSEIEVMPPTVDWEGGSNFLLETFQLPMLPEMQREAAARWWVVEHCPALPCPALPCPALPC